jgi:PDZ domain-containing protein
VSGASPFRWLVVAAALFLAACATAGPIGPIREPVSVKFQRGLQGHIILPVTVEGVKGYAVLDNGASTSVVDRRFAQEQSLAHGAIARILIKTLRGGFEFGQGASMSVGKPGEGNVEEKVTPLVLDIDLLSQAAGLNLIGIVGEEFFERHVVAIDFARNTLTFYDPRTFTPPLDLTPLPLKSKYTAKTRLPATIENENGYEITFDLGASGYAMIDEGELADKMMADGRPWIPRSSGIVRKGEFMRHDGRTITAKEIGFAGFSLQDIPTDVAAKGFVAPSDVSLGVNALSRFDIIFDIGGKRMWMRPNASYDDPFPHRVVGVDFRVASQPGAVEVLSVAQNSPAERAGLKKGDIIARLNGLEAQPNGLATVKAGDTVEVELRNGSKLTIRAARFY